MHAHEHTLEPLSIICQPCITGGEMGPVTVAKLELET